MQSETYHRLQEIFAQCNEETISFYSDITGVLPIEQKSIALDCLRQNLDISNLLFKQVAELLHKN